MADRDLTPSEREWLPKAKTLCDVLQLLAVSERISGRYGNADDLSCATRSIRAREETETHAT